MNDRYVSYSSTGTPNIDSHQERDKSCLRPFHLLLSRLA